MKKVDRWYVGFYTSAGCLAEICTYTQTAKCTSRKVDVHGTFGREAYVTEFFSVEGDAKERLEEIKSFQKPMTHAVIRHEVKWESFYGGGLFNAPEKADLWDALFQAGLHQPKDISTVMGFSGVTAEMYKTARDLARAENRPVVIAVDRTNSSEYGPKGTYLMVTQYGHIDIAERYSGAYLCGSYVSNDGGIYKDFLDEMTVEQAKDYAREVGERVTGRGIRKAAKNGYIPGARKIGRDWLIPYKGINYYFGNRPPRGPKPSKRR